MDGVKEKCIIFGKGWYFAQKEKEIRKKYDIIAFLDNSVSERDDKNKSYNPTLIGELDTVKIIVMSNTYFIEMFVQLKNLGVESERIDFGINLPMCVDGGEKELAALSGRVAANGSQLFVKYGEEEIPFDCLDEYKRIIRNLPSRTSSAGMLLRSLPLEPKSRRFGLEFGRSVARHYIDQFIEQNCAYIQGNVLEVGDDGYTKNYGTDLKDTYILHVEGKGHGNIIQGNLETGEIGNLENSIDCFICTQTIQMIYGVSDAVKSIYRILRLGGKALITVSGISQLSISDYHSWGEYWRFTELSLKRLLMECFSEDNIEIYAFGNAKTAMALMYGICVEEMDAADLDYKDNQYPVIVGAVVRK